jgi:hypothetical protein
MKKNEIVMVFVISLASWLLVASTGIAASTSWVSTHCNIDFLPGSPDKKERLDHAKSLYKLINLIHKSIPTLSPSEKKWLNAEMRSGGKRMMDVWDTDEYLLHMAKEEVDSLKNNLSSIIDGDYKDQKSEVYFWLNVADKMMRGDMGGRISKLVQKGLISISSDSDWDNGELIRNIFDGYGSNILTSIVQFHIDEWLSE